jgi:hypothetical protein
MTHQIIDNFLNVETFIFIKNRIFGANGIPWYFLSKVSGNGAEKDGYFTHTFFENYVATSNQFELLRPIIETIEVKALVRA